MSPAKAFPPEAPAQIVEEADYVRVQVAGRDLGLALRPIRHEMLTLERARDAVQLGDGWIVRYRRASPEAKELLQKKRIHYASDYGEIFVLDPPIAINQSAPRVKSAPNSASAAGGPFATKASRVSRWLLNHSGETFTVRDLAAKTKLSEGAVSTTVRELNDRMLVSVERDPNDARARRIRVANPGRLLEAWERAWELKRVRVLSWDIGTLDVEATWQQARDVLRRNPQMRCAVGGLAGADALVRAVEPVDVFVWVDEDDIPAWESQLHPFPTRGRPGTLRLAVVPDPFIFNLAQEKKGLPVADPAQLCLDCAREGERALEAVDAIRRYMHW